MGACGLRAGVWWRDKLSQWCSDYLVTLPNRLHPARKDSQTAGDDLRNIRPESSAVRTNDDGKRQSLVCGLYIHRKSGKNLSY